MEVMKIMVASFKRSHACTAALSAPNPAAGHHQPTPLPETPGHSQAGLGQSLVGSLLLSPGSWRAQGSVCALKKSVSPVLCKFWWLYGGLMATSTKRTYASMLPFPGRLQSVCLTPRQPTINPHLCRRLPNTHRQVWLRLLWGHCSFLLGPDVYKVLLCPRRVSWSPVLWKFCNEILLTFKVRFPWDS